jgi:CRP/FNR family transcriptional regulator, cyclic AMP receptor protein
MTFMEELEPEEREALAELGSPRRFRAGEAIFHEGDDAGTVFVLVDGRVKTTVMAEGGREVILTFPGPGELLGEVSALGQGPRAATVVALEPVEALAISGSAFRGYLETRPRALMLVMQQVIARLLAADHQRAEFAGYDVTGRVARRLVELAEEHGEPSEEGIAIGLPISQEELASWTGASREAVGKSLSLLRELGWIRTDRRRITVRDAEALGKYAG